MDTIDATNHTISADRSAIRKGGADRTLTVDERGTFLFNLYAFSFSELGDDVAQWRAYGGTIGGYSIGFDTSAWQLRTSRSMLHSVENQPIVFNIIYDRELQEKIIIDGIRNIAKSLEEDLGELDGENINIIAAYSHQIRHFVFEVMGRFKSPCFRAEKEWRLLMVNFRHERENASPITCYRIGAYSIIPYVKSEFSKLAGQFPTISEIMVGPQYHREMAVGAMRDFINDKKLPFASVSESKVPLRF